MYVYNYVFNVVQVVNTTDFVLLFSLHCYRMNIEDSKSSAMIHSQSVPTLKHSQTGNGSVTEASYNRSQSDGDWKVAWKGAVIKAKEAKDPWAKYKIAEGCKTERAVRYRYNALEKKWVRDNIEIKMQQEVLCMFSFLQKTHSCEL